MTVTRVKQKWTNRINEVTIGTGDTAVTVGGESTLPFLHDEGEMPNRPVIALDVYDTVPDTWTDVLLEALGDAVNDPVQWALKGRDECNVDLISLHLTRHAAEDNPASPEECAEVARNVAEATGLPLIIWGIGEAKPDNALYPVVSQALSGQKCLFARATEDNYKTLTATCIADGHNILGESPIDINICKQVNILVSDMGMPLERVVIYPTNGALGYGLEYAYSILERTRSAALGGDKLMSMPILANIGPECQRAKEVKASESEVPEWGSQVERGVNWETVTAVTYLQAGADILTMCHPEAIALVREYIDDFMKGTAPAE